jgi:hypothetical protein
LKFYEPESDCKSDRNDIMQNVSEIRILISKTLEDFHIIQKGKLDEFCREIEETNLTNVKK